MSAENLDDPQVEVMPKERRLVEVPVSINGGAYVGSYKRPDFPPMESLTGPVLISVGKDGDITFADFVDALGEGFVAANQGLDKDLVEEIVVDVLQRSRVDEIRDSLMAELTGEAVCVRESISFPDPFPFSSRPRIKPGDYLNLRAVVSIVGKRLEETPVMARSDRLVILPMMDDLSPEFRRR